ncbi:MAG: DNA polymerase [Nitrososphaerales archaeon]
MDWRIYLSKWVKVEQQVLDSDQWVPIEFEGWVAQVIARDSTVELVLHDNSSWLVEGADVRGSRVLKVVDGAGPWITHPDRWLRTEDGWERVPVEAKATGCHCERCSLVDGSFVNDPARVGSCDIVFVGEAPGYDEVRASKYFVGKAGRLIRAVLQQIGLTEYRYVFNNACLCFDGNTPDEDAIKACRDRLHQEIERCNPKLVVALGAVSLKALTDLAGISDYQGLLMPWKGTKLLACYHPAAVLRRPDLFYAFTDALYKARLYLEGDTSIDVQPEDLEVVVVSDDGMLQSAMGDLQKASKLYVDIETSGYDPFRDRLLCVALSWQDSSTKRASRKSYVFSWDFIKARLSVFSKLLQEVPSAYWNAMFDAQFLRQNGLRPCSVEDVMLKQYTLDENPLEQSLKGCARRYCNAPDWEAPLAAYLPSKSTSFEVVPIDVLSRYNGYDAAYTGVLDDLLSSRMDENNWKVYRTILVPALQMFLDTCEVGLRVDLARLETVRAELQAKLQELQDGLRTIFKEQISEQVVRAMEQSADEVVEQWERVLSTADRFNPSSVRDARALIMSLGLKTNGSTSRASLEDYRNITGVDLLLKYRETRKLLSTYIEGLVDDLRGDVIHPNIRLNGTVTGRLSCANPNLFGIPDEKGGIKKLYLPRWPGWGIGVADGAQMEIRVLGALSNDRRMIEDFQKGVDFHGAARHRLYGRGYSKKNYTHQEVLDAKTAVFGPIYGRGPESLAQQFFHSELLKLRTEGKPIKYTTWEELPEWERRSRILQAQDHIDRLWEPYPTALAWLKANVAKAQESGELCSYYGRYRRWGLVTEAVLEDIKTKGRNFPVQSAASDTNLLIMLGSYHTYKHDIYFPIFPVHDSVVFMYKLGCEQELIPSLKRYFETTAQELLNTDMKFEYEFTIGPSWGDQSSFELKEV